MYGAAEAASPQTDSRDSILVTGNPAKPFFAGEMKRWPFFQHNSYDTDLTRNGGTAHDNVQAGKTRTKV
jgi:hypothetical protein